jgi:hypothetical protein
MQRRLAGIDLFCQSQMLRLSYAVVTPIQRQLSASRSARIMRHGDVADGDRELQIVHPGGVEKLHSLGA